MLTVLGPIVRLQIQTSSLKTGPRGYRVYDPAPIRSVPAVILSEGGVAAWDERGLVLDVHHRDHPAAKNVPGVNAVSILFTVHYVAMQARFGPHLLDGVAGESILVETGKRITFDDLQGGMRIVTGEGSEGRLVPTKIAEPCVEFTRFSMRYDADAPADEPFLASLDFLRDGMRGFYLRYAGEPLTVRLGDRVALL